MSRVLSIAAASVIGLLTGAALTSFYYERISTVDVKFDQSGTTIKTPQPLESQTGQTADILPQKIGTGSEPRMAPKNADIQSLDELKAMVAELPPIEPPIISEEDRTNRELRESRSVVLSSNEFVNADAPYLDSKTLDSATSTEEVDAEASLGVITP